MKKLIFTLLGFLALYNADAQSCGNSGPSVCDSIILGEPGFYPVRDSFPPVLNGVDSSYTIYFQNYDSSGPIKVNSLRIDSIENLPNGLCWASNLPNNTFSNKQNGCIKISGTPCAPTGQYKLRIWVTVNTVFTFDAETRGLRYFVRVNNAGDTETPLDTATNVAGFVAYGAAPSGCNTAINDPSSPVTTIRITPNPMNNKAEVNFFSNHSSVMTETLTNMLGSVMFKNEINVRTGNNISSFERNNLPTGVYFYSIGDGKSSATKRIIISE